MQGVVRATWPLGHASDAFEIGSISAGPVRECRSSNAEERKSEASNEGLKGRCRAWASCQRLGHCCGKGDLAAVARPSGCEAKEGGRRPRIGREAAASDYTDCQGRVHARDGCP